MHEPQQLSSVCGGTACTTSGSARRTTGLTADTPGYELGPGAGTLFISHAPSALSVMVRGHGTFSVQQTGRFGSQHNVPADYTWIDIDDADGGPTDITLAVGDDGTVLHVADLRTTTSFANCSVAPAGPR